MLVTPVDRLLEDLPQTANTQTNPASWNPANRDVETFLARHQLQVRRSKSWEGGTLWELETCPFNPDHTGGCAAVTQGGSGVRGFKCQHNSCAGFGWRNLREKLEGPMPLDRPGTESGPLPAVVSGLDLYDSEVRDLKPLVRVLGGEGLLTPGVNLFVAKPKLGKSWLALQLSIGIAGGSCPDGLSSCQTGPVLYCALEESQRRTALRLRKLAARSEYLSDLHFCYELLPLQGGGVEQLELLINKTKPVFIVIDTLTALVKNARQGGDVFRQQYSEITELRKIAERHNVAILLIHHTRKQQGGDVVESVAGTGGLSAAADCLMMLTRKPEGHYELQATGREVEECAYALRFEKGETCPFGWRVIGDAGEETLTQNAGAVLRAITEDGPATPVQVATITGLKRNTVRTVVRRLVQNGRIVKEKGKYSLVAVSKTLSQTLSQKTDETGSVSGTAW